ncbi:RNA-binding protein 48 isoform X2 [Leucoraja erinacea]|uniref:RNA-binding protein 48 isoform X2 n=1 Tax=Leucoraja erinaceus TaxID=7782 RepID=UPI00245891D6|nr:RNA-binding protein 48 isoform X2 [Leucoraja erinacea]
MAAHDVEALKHHQQKDVCFTRPKYREGRRLRAVKVYTINLESRHLLIQGVAAVGVMKELIELFALYGTIEEYFALDEYPAEEFTEVYHIKYQKLQSARIAKRKQDEKSFYGGLLHVCYAPEFETIEDTRAKLNERRRYILRTTGNRDRYVGVKYGGHAIVSPTVMKGRLSEKPEQCESSEPDQQERNADFTMYGFPMLLPPPQEEGQQSFSISRFRQENPQVSLSHAILDEDVRCMKNCYESPLPYSHKQNLDKSNDSKNIRSSETKARVSNFRTCVSRFVPRNMQLQVKKKINQQMDINVFDRLPADDAPIIGPKRPDMPKVDMEDNSLNISASLIRNKLTEVLSVSTTEAEEMQTKPPKQRRRI